MSRNPVARELKDAKYRKRVERKKKGKGTYRRKRKHASDDDAGDGQQLRSRTGHSGSTGEDGSV